MTYTSKELRTRGLNRAANILEVEEYNPVVYAVGFIVVMIVGTLIVSAMYGDYL